MRRSPALGHVLIQIPLYPPVESLLLLVEFIAGEFHGASIGVPARSDVAGVSCLQQQLRFRRRQCGRSFSVEKGFRRGFTI